jgi:zinc protease
MTELASWLQNTKRHISPNGLTILTHPLPNSEVAALHFCVKAGYFCETDAEIGLAHLLEHMYFKGSKNYPVPESMGIGMKALGGSINASTSYDETNYFCEVPAENLNPALDIMGDAFVYPLFPADELERECEVVIEEFNRKLDSPSSYSIEKMIQLAYARHRMKRWRIGTPQQLRSYTQESLFDYFRRYYMPQNMIVTVAGKFDEQQILDKINQLFSAMPNRELNKDFGPSEPKQERLRYAMHTAEATQSYLYFAFHTPGVMHEDQPALDFLTSLLSSGRSARLHRYIVENRRSASAVSCGEMAYEDVGLLVASAVTEASKIRDAGRDIWSVIQDTLENGITEGELAKVKNKLKLHQAMQTEDALNLAELLSYNEVYGGYERIDTYIQAMEELTAEKILETASRYIRTSNMTVLEFLNEPLPEWNADQYLNHLESGYMAPEIVLPPPIVLTAGSLAPTEQSANVPDLRKGKVTYLFYPDHHYPFVSGGIFFMGGRSEEQESNAGITHMMFRAIAKGTSKFNAEQIAFRFDALGNPPRFSCNRDVSGFTFEAMPDRFTEMWDLLMHCITDGHFPESEIETERGKVISAIRRNLDDSFVRPIQLFQRAYYGSHPYGLPENGFEETVKKITPADLMAWKNRVFHSERVLVSAAGNFDPDEMFERFEKRFQDFPSSGVKVVPPPDVSGPVKRELNENRPKKQTAFVLGFPAPSATHPDAHLYDLLQQILSGMGGRLFINLRSKKSLAYTVYAGAASHLYAGTFLTYIAGDASKEKQALEGMWEELETLKKEPVTEEELENARQALIGGYALSTQSASAKMIDAINCYLLGKPLPYAPVYRQLVRAATADDILKISQLTFNRETATLGVMRGTTEKTDAEKLVLA